MAQTVRAGRPYFHYEAGKILLGQVKDGRRIGVRDNRHLVTIAGSRAGKSATSLLFDGRS